MNQSFRNGYLIFGLDWEPIEWMIDEMDVDFTFWGNQTDAPPENNPSIKV
jgi:hypothetical protein